MNSSGLYDLWHMVREGEIGIRHHSEVLDTLCWRDLITKNIDWKVRKKLLSVVFRTCQNELAFVGVEF